MLTIGDFRRELEQLVRRGTAAALDPAEMAVALEFASVDAERIVAGERDGDLASTSGGANRRHP